MPSKATKSTNKKPDKSIIPSSSTSNTSTKSSKPPSKKPSPPTSNKPSATTTEFDLTLPAQQTILDTFSAAFPVDDVDALKARVQTVKGYLYARKFGEAFGGEGELREAYAIRWSPGRAVGYAGVFSGLSDVLRLRGKGGGGRVSRSTGEVCKQGKGEDGSGIEDGLVGKQEAHRRKVVCVGGGGGAELVALARHLTGGLESEEGKQQDETAQQGSRGIGGVDCVLVDVADWKGVTEKLMVEVNANVLGTTRPDRITNDSEEGEHGGVTLEDGLADMTISSTSPAPTPQSPPLLLYAESVQADVLTLPPAQLRSLFSPAHLVTIMFTLNELYTASSTLTTTFLLSLTDVLTPGAMLLVLDSPGSYSTVGVGADGRERKYPMAWLLDHTLLVSAGGAQGTGRKGAEEGSDKTLASESEMDEGEEVRQRGEKASSVKRQQWEKIEECDSRWCRLAKGLRYPIELEDMRYQLHLYRRI